jgi:hypothetical protein
MLYENMKFLERWIKHVTKCYDMSREKGHAVTIIACSEEKSVCRKPVYCEKPI